MKAHCHGFSVSCSTVNGSEDMTLLPNDHVLMASVSQDSFPD